MSESDVLIIGAGPSGAIAAALLARSGYRVSILERARFPRFSIGESLLPQSMAYIEEAGMLEAVQQEGFQLKNGAAFSWRERRAEYDFRHKFTPGWGTTFQVQRARFDQILADEAARQGVDVRYEHEITRFERDGEESVLYGRDDQGQEREWRARFVLDASGFGRVLPRLLELETPSRFPVRQAIFTHIEDRIEDSDYDRNKILIAVHPDCRDVWYWLIPFQDGRASLGVVAERDFLEAVDGDLDRKLQTVCWQDPNLRALLANAVFDTPARTLVGYSANVKSLWGDGYALLGNAGEFLDPVFSSGVTIAMRSASMAAALLKRQLAGEAVDWEQEFALPLKKGVNTFRTYVEAWYDGRFQDVIFFPEPQEEIKEMVCSILAGYAWDERNPYVKDSDRRLQVLHKICTRSG